MYSTLCLDTSDCRECVCGDRPVHPVGDSSRLVAPLWRTHDPSWDFCALLEDLELDTDPVPGRERP